MTLISSVSVIVVFRSTRAFVDVKEAETINFQSNVCIASQRGTLNAIVQRFLDHSREASSFFFACVQVDEPLMVSKAETQQWSDPVSTSGHTMHILTLLNKGLSDRM